MPYKDEIKALGYAPVDFYHKAVQNKKSQNKMDLKNTLDNLTSKKFIGLQQEQQEMQ